MKAPRNDIKHLKILNMNNKTIFEKTLSKSGDTYYGTFYDVVEFSTNSISDICPISIKGTEKDENILPHYDLQCTYRIYMK